LSSSGRPAACGMRRRPRAEICGSAEAAPHCHGRRCRLPLPAKTGERSTPLAKHSEIDSRQRCRVLRKRSKKRPADHRGDRRKPVIGTLHSLPRPGRVRHPGPAVFMSHPKGDACIAKSGSWGLTDIDDKVPGAKMIWLFRESWGHAGVPSTIFSPASTSLYRDRAISPARRQHNGQGEKGLSKRARFQSLGKTSPPRLPGRIAMRRCWWSVLGQAINGNAEISGDQEPRHRHSDIRSRQPCQSRPGAWLHPG
jgi:hypothetical protein